MKSNEDGMEVESIECSCDSLSGTPRFKSGDNKIQIG